MKRPRPFPSGAFAELESSISRGYFRRFDDPTQLPSAISRLAAFPEPVNFRASVVMSANSSEHPPAIGGLAPAATSPVMRVATLRVDKHGQAGEIHLNRDDVLLFKDQTGKAWQLYAHDQPSHYRRLSTDSSLDVALEQHRWPKETSGTLQSLRSNGAWVDFSTGLGRRAV